MARVYIKKVKKKGQEGGAGAAALVALIAFFVLLFIVFLPPDQRAQILDDTKNPLTTGVNGSSNAFNGDGNYLLLENPGSIVPPIASAFTYPIAPVEISSRTEATELERVGSVSVKRSLFTTQHQEVNFELENPALVEGALLNFKVREARGNLIIIFNGREIFNREITEAYINPISLPSSALDENNVIEFHAQPVGGAFWSVNRYTIEDVTVTADVLDLSNSVAESIFYVPSQDVNRMINSRLFFQPVCGRNSGKLSVTLNGVDVYTSKPVCNSVSAIDFSPTILLDGNNKVRFSVDEGAYSLSRMRVSSEPRAPEQYVYFFKVVPRLYDDVFFGHVDVVASLKFASAGEKDGKLVVNGFVRSFETKEAGYALDISDFIEEGFNSIELIPDEPMQVVELRVDVE